MAIQEIYQKKIHAKAQKNLKLVNKYTLIPTLNRTSLITFSYLALRHKYPENSASTKQEK